MSFFTYQKVSDTSMPVDEVEAWLNKFPQKRAENKPNGGIIRSTATVVFTDGAKYKMSKKERKAAITRAQREHKAAMRELAIQDAKDQSLIAKQRKVWAKEISALQAKAEPKVPRTSAINARKDALELRLRNGERIAAPCHATTKSEYSTMRRDMLALKKRFSGKIVRLKDLYGEQSFYTLDELETFGGDIEYNNENSVLAALNTKKAVRINSEMHRQEVKNLATMMRKIDGVTGIYGLDCSIKGWVML